MGRGGGSFLLRFSGLLLTSLTKVLLLCTLHWGSFYMTPRSLETQKKISHGIEKLLSAFHPLLAKRERNKRESSSTYPESGAMETFSSVSMKHPEHKHCKTHGPHASNPHFRQAYLVVLGVLRKGSELGPPSSEPEDTQCSICVKDWCRPRNLFSDLLQSKRGLKGLGERAALAFKRSAF